MSARPWITRVALAAFALLLYWGVAADWWLPRVTSG
jgi:hypothetical protein